MILEVVPAARLTPKRASRLQSDITPQCRDPAHLPASIGTYYRECPPLVPRDNGYSVRLKSHMPITSVGIPIRHGFTPDLRRVTLSDCRRPARKEPPRCAGIDFLGLIVMRPDWMIGV